MPLSGCRADEGDNHRLPKSGAYVSATALQVKQETPHLSALFAASDDAGRDLL
jgi:hypothetical protein